MLMHVFNKPGASLRTEQVINSVITKSSGKDCILARPERGKYMTTKNHFKVAPGKAPAMRALVLALILALVALPTSAGTDSGGGVTLTFPDSQTSCTPDGAITTTGVDPAWTVRYDFFAVVGGVLTRIGGGTTTGDLNVQFPYPALSGTTQFAVFIAVSDAAGNPVINPETGRPLKLGGQWTVTCTPGEGCTPGFWKNHTELWAALGYNTTDDFDTTFGVNFFSPDEKSRLIPHTISRPWSGDESLRAPEEGLASYQVRV
jgi:hypothetical protein